MLDFSRQARLTAVLASLLVLTGTRAENYRSASWLRGGLSYSRETSTIQTTKKWDSATLSYEVARNYPKWLASSDALPLGILRFDTTSDGERVLLGQTGLTVIAFNHPQVQQNGTVILCITGGMLASKDINGQHCAGCGHLIFSLQPQHRFSSTELQTGISSYRPSLFKLPFGKAVYCGIQAPFHKWVMRKYHRHTAHMLSKMQTDQVPAELSNHDKTNLVTSTS
jgi:hypothetical protein